MKTAAEYRAMADECFKWARQARADEVRVSLLQLAQVWLDARLDHPDKVSARRTKKTARSADWTGGRNGGSLRDTKNVDS